MEFERPSAIFVDIDAIVKYLTDPYDGIRRIMEEYQGITEDDFSYIDMNKVYKAIAEKMLDKLKK